MKSCLSLLAALLVMMLLAAGGYFAYQKSTAPANQNGYVLTVLSGDTSLTLTNATAFVLTVTMRQGAMLVRFQLPGKERHPEFPAGNLQRRWKPLGLIDRTLLIAMEFPKRRQVQRQFHSRRPGR